uniref:Putative secreted protein n=1 Tax=Ixodes ricinus TaxID=34613 RepID=A0A6B0U7T5_IXORI
MKGEIGQHLRDLLAIFQLLRQLAVVLGQQRTGLLHLFSQLLARFSVCSQGEDSQSQPPSCYPQGNTIYQKSINKMLGITRHMR